MKSLPPGLQTHLDTGATTLCWCWRIERRDGFVLGSTDHDETLSFAGTAYEAATGFTAGDVESALGLAVDNLPAAGALSAGGITEADIAAGLYDGAAVEVWRVNWAEPEQRVLMRKGSLGQVKRGRLAFEAEIRGLAQQLNEPVGRAYGHACDADLGDARCTVDLGLAAFRSTGTVSAVTDARRFQASGLGAFESGWFSAGILTWTSGLNAGRVAEVKRHATAGIVTIELWQPMSSALASGDGFAVTAGCDKQFGTCKTKFTNGINFRGFPYMPGNDAVLSYPSRGDLLDGGSRYGS